MVCTYLLKSRLTVCRDDMYLNAVFSRFRIPVGAFLKADHDHFGTYCTYLLILRLIVFKADWRFKLVIMDFNILNPDKLHTINKYTHSRYLVDDLEDFSPLIFFSHLLLIASNDSKFKCISNLRSSASSCWLFYLNTGLGRIVVSCSLIVWLSWLSSWLIK